MIIDTFLVNMDGSFPLKNKKAGEQVTLAFTKSISKNGRHS